MNNSLQTRHDARILIVDDEPANVSLLERILEKSGFFNVIGLTDPEAVEAACTEGTPDLVLLDVMMPYRDGFEVLTFLRDEVGKDRYLPVIMLTADVTAKTRHRALSSGAKDFLTKPFDAGEVILRVDNLLETRFLYQDLQKQNDLLEVRVVERTRDLHDSQLEVITRLAQAAELRDDDTGQHTRRVGELAALLAQNLGLSPMQVELIRQTAPLHDVGKIGIPDAILLKPDKLTTEEFDVIKQHTHIGSDLLDEGNSEFMCMAEIIARTHHEKWAGGGYPSGLSGEDINLEGRIVAVADVFDALTNNRPYKKAWAWDEAIQEIQRNAGTQFDPAVVAVLEKSLQEFATKLL